MNAPFLPMAGAKDGRDDDDEGEKSDEGEETGEGEATGSARAGAPTRAGEKCGTSEVVGGELIRDGARWPTGKMCSWSRWCMASENLETIG
jgi:hypothetical protein